MTPRQAAVETGDDTASGMLEIGRVNLQFAAARCETVPFGTILASFLSTPGVNRRFGVLFVCCCVAAGGYRGG
jgi:hypothetical protein|eukprot:COSAG02_NODE_14592_length_1256_cov_2.488332_2_plen_73_part_00